MITTNLPLLHQNWTFLGEGKEHVIFKHVEPKTQSGHLDICVDAVLPAKICHDAGAEGNFVVTNTTESDVTSSIEHRVLRLTKKKFDADDILQDELFLIRVIKPWLGSSYCPERELVFLTGVFLEGLPTV